MYTAALIEPLAVTVRAIGRLDNDMCEPILIFGDGPIGLLMVQLLRLRGKTEITLIGGRNQRLEKAANFGAVRTFNYHDLGNDIAEALGQLGAKNFTTIIEASGSLSATASVIKLAQLGGKILLIGDYPTVKEDSVWQQIMLNQLEVIGSNASAGAWPEAVKMAVGGELDLGEIITHRLKAERFGEGIELMRTHQGDVTKVVLEWK